MQVNKGNGPVVKSLAKKGRGSLLTPPTPTAVTPATNHSEKRTIMQHASLPPWEICPGRCFARKRLHGPAD